jgi:hypothetical protein
MREQHAGRATRSEQHGEQHHDRHGESVGRTTLTEHEAAPQSLIYQLDRAAPEIPAEVGIHAGGAAHHEWKDIPADEASGAADDGQLRALGVERNVEPNDANVPGEDDDRHLAHASAATSGHHMAPTDEYNKSAVSSHNKTHSGQLFRPGVRFGGSNGVDILHPKIEAHRWLIDDHGLGHARDKVTPRTPVAFNLAPLLHREGQVWALTFVKGRGALWMSLNAFRDAGMIEKTISAQSKPVLPSANVGGAQLARRVFRSASGDDGLARYKDLYILPGKGGPENKLDHYRYRGNTHLYNVLLNLPQTASPGQNEAPPVAVDSAQPGWSFYIASGAQFRRQVPLFAAGSHTPSVFVTYIYGFIGQATRWGEQADTNRRGWVLGGTLSVP